MANALIPNQNILNRRGYSDEGIDLSLYQGGSNQSGYGLAQLDPYGRVQIGGDPGLQEYLNYLAAPQTREVMGNVLADTIPVSAQGQAIERLKQQYTALQNAQSPIQAAVRAADIGLEGGALVADVLPYGKAAVTGLGALGALMSRKGVPEGIARAPQAANQLGMTGWHGSPHKFDRFDHSNMGKGEGAQAYGWGTYIAESPDVGLMYKRKEGINNITYNGRIVPDDYKSAVKEIPDAKERDAIWSLKQSNGEDIDGAIAEFEYNAGVDFRSPAERAGWQEKADTLRRLRDKVSVEETGNLYSVDLPDEKIAQMLDWDAPLSEQPESVRRALERDGLLNKTIDEYADNFRKVTGRNPTKDNPTGADIYQMITHQTPSEEAASKHLNSLGIPGIKYFDGNSRGAGQGTRNFVVFDENDMKILTRNGEDIAQSADSLPMDEASRMARAKEMGNTTPAYTGTTHNITEFDASIANPESDWGKGVYATTSIDDANQNYAGVGPDLTQRIDLEAEKVADELMDYPDELLEEYGISTSRYEQDEAGVAMEIAKKRLVGEAEGGSVYPINLNTNKYAVIGGEDSTKLTQPDYYDLARSDLDIADYSDEVDFEDAVAERAWEIQSEDTDSLYYRVSEALKDTDAYFYEQQISDVMESLQDDLMEGILDIDDLDDAIRANITEAIDDSTGEMSSPGAVSAQTLKNLGFEGVIDNKVNQKFGAGRQYGAGMAGLDNNTQHIITFPDYEHRIRGKYAKYDPKKWESKNILAGGAAAALGLNALLDDRKEYVTK